MQDIDPRLYTTVIREMIRHENDVTNHRIMWLLMGQGFIINTYISEKGPGASTGFMLPLVEILVALSVFVLLDKSYRARGCFQCLGHRAKHGTRPEEDLPLTGWPRKRIKGCWRDVWGCPWIGRPSDMAEPWLFLPLLFTFLWLTALLLQQARLGNRG